uniref:Uncharacterized protein MANES_05G008900 n=2 Tax=Rhizophora mucronata TaxID=61149 RepID=A0A2P2JWH8_RHIMU
MGKRNRGARNTIEASKSSGLAPHEKDCFEGERLAQLLKLIQGGIESAKLLEQNSLPEKFWYKQQFAIGVNEVTRVLERMSPTADLGNPGKQPRVFTANRQAPSVQLQAILVASDCNPKWLTKHLPSLASSRNVLLIYVKDNKGGSLRLGELVKLKTAMAVGVKAKENAVNQIFEENFHLGDAINLEGDSMTSTPCQ